MSKFFDGIMILLISASWSFFQGQTYVPARSANINHWMKIISSGTQPDIFSEPIKAQFAEFSSPIFNIRSGIHLCVMKIEAQFGHFDGFRINLILFGALGFSISIGVTVAEI
jgi:hypothetical protein